MNYNVYQWEEKSVVCLVLGTKMYCLDVVMPYG